MTKITAVTLQDALGVPRAYPVVIHKTKHATQALIVLSLEQRRSLNEASKNSGACKDGIDWCAQVYGIRNREFEGGKRINVESMPRYAWSNGETLAIDTASVIDHLPKPYVGHNDERRPTTGMCWGEAYLVEAVRLAHTLVSKTAPARETL